MSIGLVRQAVHSQSRKENEIFEMNVSLSRPVRHRKTMD